MRHHADPVVSREAGGWAIGLPFAHMEIGINPMANGVAKSCGSVRRHHEAGNCSRVKRRLGASFARSS